MTDISGWIPDWGSAGTSLASHGPRLRSLRGRRVVRTWIVWILDLDCWFPDLPVVVVFDDGTQLEICWQKFDDLSISWNTIDVNVTPEMWGTWTLEWRPDAEPVLGRVVGESITSVASTEHLFTTWPAGPTADRKPDDVHAVWLVGGLWLQTTTAGLHIFNALDENGLANEAPETSSEHRRTWI